MLSNRDREFIDIVVGEMLRGAEKYGTYSSTHEAYAVILEELDEMWEAVKVNDIENAVMEAVQVAATALRFVIEFWERKNARIDGEVTT